MKSNLIVCSILLASVSFAQNTTIGDVDMGEVQNSKA